MSEVPHHLLEPISVREYHRRHVSCSTNITVTVTAASATIQQIAAIAIDSLLDADLQLEANPLGVEAEQSGATGDHLLQLCL